MCEGRGERWEKEEGEREKSSRGAREEEEIEHRGTERVSM